MSQHPLPETVTQAMKALLTHPATLTHDLRKRIEAYAAKRSGGERDDQAIPEELIGYVNKIIFHAYQITDEDIQSLKDTGYTEDNIFEITLCASMGASLGRYESGMRVVKDCAL